MLTLNSKTKHFLHCCLFICVICTGQLLCMTYSNSSVNINPWMYYGYGSTFLLYLSRLSMLLLLPQTLFTFVGLIYYNAFNDNIELRKPCRKSPFVCFRVVTRGDFPDLVKNNVKRNLKTCEDAGLQRFNIEVVTQKYIGLEKHRRVREIVVPKEYKTRSGALFKARNLQYCLENGVNQLSSDDWIVHLDEDTILTVNSIKGILNFVSDGRYQFGEGLITYADEEVVNWITTTADFYRIAFELGELQLQLKMFHRLLICWKGSFLVCQCGAERDVSFDNGVEGSVTEDIFFGLKAASKGYSFGFVEGEMWEKSPFTIYDYIQQRKRWMQGFTLVVTSKALPLKVRLLPACGWFSSLLLPFTLISFAFPLSFPTAVNSVFAFIFSTGSYMCAFGVLRSFPISRCGFRGFLLCLLASVYLSPFQLGVQCVATIWALFDRKRNFYIVNKNPRSIIEL